MTPYSIESGMIGSRVVSGDVNSLEGLIMGRLVKNCGDGYRVTEEV